MVFTQWPSAHLPRLGTWGGLGTISRCSHVARFVQGGVGKVPDGRTIPMDDELKQSAGSEAGESADGFSWYEPAAPTPREQCPCCDFVSLPERGNCLICPICFWEDDGVDLANLDGYSLPNHMTLREGRANFTRTGACDEAMLKNVLPITKRNLFEHRPRNF